ncbi:Cuticlin-6 [Pseudolycoriella hygida]|uniref:Cuticlin-6 n=1 Tax=Pseudolycoriella hygida TaxID=35572 RepID=A0A9Q0MYX9_9DIPT|nr:Cuticlin-6 [Pseudolycoriella hygida]
MIFHHRHSVNAFITVTIIIIQICQTMSSNIDTLDSTSTEYSVVGQTSSISTSSNGASLILPSDKITTKIYGTTITPTPKLQKRTSTISNSKSKKPLVDGKNHSREALSHEESQREPVVYLSDTSGYVPVTSLRGRPGVSIPPSAPYHTAPDLETWRPDPWDRDYTHRHRYNTTRVQHIEAECQDDYMKIRVGFNGSFTGLLYSAGYAYDPDCMYINGSGRDYYEFFIQLNRCGTLGKNAIHEKSRENPTNFMWNTITVQYNPLIEEEFDEHFKVTCEYGYDFWKTVTFPFLDVEVATGNPVVFTLSPPECYMEIRNGYGVGGNRVTGPVRVGDPLTLIIYMRSKYDGFDIVVNDCYAHNGANKRIQLIDEYGCPVDDKLISRFRGTWSDTGVYETQVYAYMKTFRFTGSPALYIECDVRMCHGRCPSQPCHWRNLKTVTKRDVSNQTIILETNSTSEEKKEAPLSDNISLFQSLRVLQEGEGDDLDEIRKIKEPYESCMKTSVLATLTAGSGLLLSILTISLFVTCSKLRDRKKESGVYDAYVNHKGQID